MIRACYRGDNFIVMLAGSLGLRTLRIALGRLSDRLSRVPARVIGAWHHLQPRHFPIAYKLALIITLVITSGMTLLGMVIVDNQTRLLRQQMNQFGHALIRQMADSVKEPLLASDALGLRLAIDTMTSHSGVLGAGVYADELEPVAHKGVIPTAMQIGELRQQVDAAGKIAAAEWPATAEADQYHVIAFFSPILVRDLTAGYVLLTFDHSQLTRAQRDTYRAVTAATLLMVLLGTIAAIIVGKRLSRPINELMDASLQVSRGDFSHRFAERRNDELGTLMQAFNTLSDGLVRKAQVEKVFSRYVAPKVAQELLSDLDQVQLGGRHVEASVLFADIAGFTSLSENLPPQEISTLLNEYFSIIADAAQAYHGHVDKYMGDCAMLVFGVPQHDDQHSLHAICCAVLIQRLISELNTRRQARGQIPVHFHISCNSGTMLAGNMGSHERMEYTVVGDAVNIASRLAAAAGAEQIIISRLLNEHAAMRGHIISRQHDTIRLRGKQQPVETYEVLDVASQHRDYLEQCFHHILRQRDPGHTA